jgi:hypothetical protein
MTLRSFTRDSLKRMFCIGGDTKPVLIIRAMDRIIADPRYLTVLREHEHLHSHRSKSATMSVCHKQLHELGWAKGAISSFMHMFCVLTRT